MESSKSRDPPPFSALPPAVKSLAFHLYQKRVDSHSAIWGSEPALQIKQLYLLCAQHNAWEAYRKSRGTKP